MNRLFYILLGCCFWISAAAQLNTDRITTIGRNALYFDDYVLSIQYFNQVIKLKPYLAEPYLLRAIAKIQLGDYTGAEADCNASIEPGAGDGQGGLACCSPWGHKELDTTERLNRTE